VLSPEEPTDASARLDVTTAFTGAAAVLVNVAEAAVEVRVARTGTTAVAAVVAAALMTETPTTSTAPVEVTVADPVILALPITGTVPKAFTVAEVVMSATPRTGATLSAERVALTISKVATPAVTTFATPSPTRAAPSVVVVNAPVNATVPDALMDASETIEAVPDTDTSAVARTSALVLAVRDA